MCWAVGKHGGLFWGPGASLQRSGTRVNHPPLHNLCLRCRLRCCLHSALQVYGSSVTPGVKRQCLTTIAKMLRFNTGDTLKALLQDLPASSLVAALLGARDATAVAFGLQVGAPG